MLLHRDNYELLKSILNNVPAFAEQSPIDQEAILRSALQSIAINHPSVTDSQQLLETNKMVIQLALDDIQTLPKIDDYETLSITREEAQTERAARMMELVKERQRQYDAAAIPISPIADPVEVFPSGDMEVLYQEQLAERSLSFFAPPSTEIIEFGETDPPTEITKHVSWQVPTSIEELRAELVDIRNELKTLRAEIDERICKCEALTGTVDDSPPPPAEM